MKKFIYVLAILSCVVCGCSRSTLHRLEMRGRAEVLISRYVKELNGVSKEDPSYSVVLAEMEKSFDEVYDRLDSDEDKAQFTQALRTSLSNSDATDDVAFIIAANIRIY